MDSALCQEHRQPSTGTSPRCGTFFCAQCGPLSVCPGCVKHALAPSGRLEARLRRAQRFALFSWLGCIVAMIGGGLGGTLFSPIAFLLIAFIPVGLGAGVVALVLNRGTGRLHVLVQALGGIAINGILLVAFVFILFG